jgi:hypothetical protein
MQHKLYSKLVARLDDGTISVDTVKHPVSFGQVAVLAAVGGMYKFNYLAGGTNTVATAHGTASDILNACKDKAVLRNIADLMSAISVFFDVTSYGRRGSDTYRELNKDFAELVLQMTTGDKASVASLMPALRALAESNVSDLLPSKASNQGQGADVLTKMLTVLAETQLEQAQKAVNKLRTLA